MATTMGVTSGIDAHPHFHFIGIGGVGMSVVAELLLDEGCVISGSDRSDSAVMRHLVSVGIDARVGHDPNNVVPGSTIVISSAIRPDNVELIRARALSCPVIHRSQALALSGRSKRFIAVAGAHGKTTTSAMLAVALTDVGRDPSFAVGGTIPEFDGGARLGRGEDLIAEADESDGSFLNYSPSVELITNVEPDHLDHFGSREAFEDTFVEFTRRLQEGGIVVCCAEDAGATRLAQRACDEGKRVLTYGRPEKSYCVPDITISEVTETASSTHAHVATQVGPVSLTVSIPGDHNLLNAVGALTVGCEVGVPAQTMSESLAGYHGTARRFEARGTVGDRRLFDDYAHHPTEVAAAIAQARLVAEGGKICVVFQPHLFSRTRTFASRFAKALSGADVVVLTDIYPAREDPIEGVDSSLISREIPRCHLVHDRHQAARLAAELTPAGGVLITMGAGSITDVAEDVLQTWQGMMHR